MSEVLKELTPGQLQRYRQIAALLQIENDRICPKLPDTAELILSSDEADAQSSLKPYFPQNRVRRKSQFFNSTPAHTAVFGIEHLEVKAHQKLTIRGPNPVFINTAKLTLGPHATIHIQTPTRLRAQVFESDENNPPPIEIFGKDGPPGQPGETGSAAAPGGPGKSGQSGRAGFPAEIDLGTIAGPVKVIIQGGSGGNGGPGGPGGAPNGPGGTGGTGGNGGPATVVSLAYDKFQAQGYVEIWNLESLAGSGGQGGLGGDGKTKGKDGKDGRPGSRGNFSFGKKNPMP